MFDRHITILVVNNKTEFVQILTHGSKYTCPTKMLDGKLVFRFKDNWLDVDKYCDQYTRIIK